MMKHRKNRILQIRLAALFLFSGFISLSLFYPRFVAQTSGGAGEHPAAETAEEAQTKPTPRRRAAPRRTPTPRRAAAPARPAKYSEFPHDIQAHKADCTACHKFPSANWNQVRKGDAAFQDITEYPYHESCISCHRQQFFRGTRPTICTICHVNPSPRDSRRHPFPNPREIFDATPKGQTAVSDFEISFPHDKHIDIVSRNENKELKGGGFVRAARFEEGGERGTAPPPQSSCAVCHQTYQPQGDAADEYFTKPPAKLGDAFWLKKGTFKTSPMGHAQCFTCHSADSGMKPAPTDCATCHQISPRETKSDFDLSLFRRMAIKDRPIFLAWRERNSSGTFRHEFSSHADIDCATCHNVTAMNTLNSLTEKVPVTSCAPCHITATSDDGGILNFEVDSRKTNAKFQCTKCHVSFGNSPVPESHLKAIAAQAGN
jgi:hypothetical protein